ncbi:MAG: 2-oxoglutarate dehydrogenase complex dihydrolipoyllysine-residue succinyltransferase [Planctomycetaceae bacterium]|nr:2-oxoglutarate dehydrogenase complex dihydrolipoyllysine-residue succinyltransferase [Planctomycetaceae bacterium]
MSIAIKVPSVGESISEVFIGEWYAPEGTWVDVDQNVVGLETDKATFDVPAPVAGTIRKVLKQAGETAAVGEVIAEMEESAQPAKVSSKDGNGKSAASAPAKSHLTAAAPTQTPSGGDGAKVMPAAARIIESQGLTPAQVPGSGPGGRVLKEDAQRAAEARKSGQTTVLVATGDTSGFREVKRVPMSPIRQTIARRLVEAQQNAALLTTFNECDMTAVKELRNQYQDLFTKKYGIKLGFMSFFVKAVVDAIAKYPALGAEVDGNHLIYHNYCDIGVAIGGGKGLVVPVLRNAERMGFADVELAIADFAQRARENKIGLEELEGGTFTITNGGVYGSLLSTPIVNPPQSGVLGMHGIVDRPIALNGQVVIRPMMYVALTYDHRVVDGREAVSFLRRVKEAIEDPTRIVLEV